MEEKNDAALTSSGVERVTVGELRLRGRRTWGSLRWLPPLAPLGDGVTPALAAPPAEPLAPSSVCCQGRGSRYRASALRMQPELHCRRQ